MNEIAFATDSQLRNIASAKANYDYASSPNRKTERKFANMLPVMDSILIGASTKGSLGSKVVSGGKELADWGVFIGLAYLYNKMIGKLVKNSDTLQDFKENSPVAFNVANAAVGVTACCSGLYYIKKGFNKFIAPHLSTGVKNFPKSLADNIDDSSFGKRINKGMAEFANNYPKITKGLKIAAVWTLPVLCAGLLITWVADLAKINKNKKATLKNLEDARLTATQQIAIENMMAAQVLKNALIQAKSSNQGNQERTIETSDADAEIAEE